MSLERANAAVSPFNQCFGFLCTVNRLSRTANKKNKHPCREVSSGSRTSGSFGVTTHRLMLGQYYVPPVDYTSNLRLWLNAADTASILNTTSGSITEGSLVGQWKDLSGNNNHAIMYSAATTPTWSATGINSKSALVFNSKHLELTTNNFMTGFTALTFMAVFQQGSIITKSHMLGNVGTSYSLAFRYFFNKKHLEPSNHYGSTLNWENTTHENLGTNDRVFLGAPGDVGLAINQTHLYCLSGDTSDNTTKLHVNGKYILSFPYGTGYTGLSWSIGRISAPSLTRETFVGNIGEIRVYNERLTDEQRSSVTSVLRNKWGF